MKFFFVDDCHYRIFINNIGLVYDFSNKDYVEEFLKKTIKWMVLKYEVSIIGLFEVNIYINDKTGIFIEFEKINSILSYRDTDLKINIIYNCNFYFKTEYFEIIKCFKDIYFKNEYFYVDVCNFKNINNYIEFGDIVYINDQKLERNFIKIK